MKEKLEIQPTYVWDGYGWRYMGWCDKEKAMAYLNSFSKIQFGKLLLD